MADQVTQVNFQDMPQLYLNLIKSINDNCFRQIYSQKIKFHYLNNYEQQNNESYLLNYLKQFKLITYEVVNLKDYNSIFHTFNKKQNDDLSKLNNVIICIEGQCLIIENIDINIIKSILNDTKSSILNIHSNSNELTKNEKQANEEVDSFKNYFSNEIDSNSFVKYTISPIIAFLIRRFFYPSNFFKDQSFFTFKFELEEKTDKIKYKEFNENDFIMLRIISSSQNKIFNLALHVKSLYIFLVKQICTHFNNSHYLEHEINFCTNYSHRCLTKFYGFITKESQIEGLVYEFMCNGNLFDYINNNKNEISYFFSFITMNRIFQGIYFLHSNSMIHRDLQYTNILIDHDNLPFISDFETIIELDPQNPEAYTQNIGSSIFCSQEQFNGEGVSYQTDIYSFGIIIYFLFEHESKIKNIQCMTKFGKNIQLLFENCIKKDRNERLNIDEIKNILIDHLLEFDSLHYYFPREKKKEIDILEMVQFYDENIQLLSLDKNEIKLKKYKKALPNISSLFLFIGNLFNEGKLIDQDFYRAKEFYEYSLQFNKNNDIALCNLGDLYRKGDGVEKNLHKAKEYYELAAQHNNADAFDCLGNFYCKGEGVEQNFHKAKEYYELAAKQGNADAIYTLGYFYFVGRVVEKNIEKAKELYEKAAEVNYPPALNGLGNIYYKNSSVEESVRKGIEYYMKAAELNNPNALLNLGYVYTNGNQFIQKDPSRGFKYFEKAAEKGSVFAYNSIGNSYFSGIGVEKDYSKAKYFFKIAAKKGCIDAYNALGHIYDTGKGVQVNYAKAIKYYEKSAERNNPNSLNNLGNIYLHGNGVPKDYLKAKNYFERSSKQGNSRAFYLLGTLYHHGLGVERNYLEAKKYYKIAAEKKFPLAFYNLGELYYNGLGVNQDFIKAEKYYKRALSYRNTKASFQLGIMYYYGKGVQQDYNEAKNYFLASANENNMNAFFYLAKMYENGKGIEINLCKAIEHYLQCVEKKEHNQVIHYNEGWTTFINDNCYYYHAFNNLGLIYLIEKQNFELAEKYIKEAGLNEHPWGQNNLGIFYQFYLDRIDDSIYFYKKAANNHFSLPEFNLGYIEEMKGNVIDSVNNYLKVLQYENEILTFRNTEIDDDFLDYSNLFIVSYTNLKLFQYYLSKNDAIKASNDVSPHKFLINAIFRPLFSLLIHMKHDSYSFKFVIDKNQANFDADNLKDFFVDFPLFNSMDIGSESKWEVIKRKSEDKIKIVLQIESKGNESNLKNNINNKNEMFDVILSKQIENIFNGLNKDDTFKLISFHIQNNIQNEIMNLENAKLKQNQIDKIVQNDLLTIELKNKNQLNKDEVTKEPIEISVKNPIGEEKYKTRIIVIKSSKDSIERIIEYPIELEEVFYQNINGKISLIDEVLKSLNDVLYKKPYPILFGRIGKIALNLNNQTENVNDSFYDGFNR